MGLPVMVMVAMVLMMVMVVVWCIYKLDETVWCVEEIVERAPNQPSTICLWYLHEIPSVG